jgi:biofilm protein TabA
MVIDRLTNSRRYEGLGQGLARALRFASETPLGTLPDGRHAIEGDAIFALVQRYATKPLAEGRWEAHRRYIDLQILVEGRERVGRGPLDRFVAEPYDAARDLLWLEGAGDLFTLEAGAFAIFWPDDVHMPGLVVDAPERVTKVVIKIAAALG